MHSLPAVCGRPRVLAIAPSRSRAFEFKRLFHSADLRERFAQHMKGNASSTAHRRPWKLIYYEAYLEQADAIGRERYLKSGAGRRFLRAQLANYLKRNPLTPTA